MLRAASRPAIALMNRLQYWQKFLLISLLFSVPLTIVISQYLVNVDHDINFSAKERLGLEYNAPLMELLVQIQNHAAITSAVTSGIENLDTNLAAVKAEISSQIASVDTINARLGRTLDVSEAWADIKAQWLALQNEVLELDTVANIEQHIALTNSILSLITQVGNNSNLILDPDIDSYYLMNNAINTLPLTISYSNQLRTYGVAALADGTLSPSEETRLTILEELARAVFDENDRSFAYSFDFNPELTGELADLSAQSRTSLNTFVEFLNSSMLTQSESAGMSEGAQIYFSLSSQMVDNSLSLYRQVSNSLDTLLVKRVDGIVNGRAFVVLVTLVTLVLTAYVFTGFYLSVRKTITAIDRAAERIISSNIPGDLVLESRDELAQAAVAFNNVAKRLDLARREAVEATRMKDMFLATMSHELRTPLNAMIGFLHLMLYSGQMDDDNVHMAERSLANTQRLLTLINNILDLSRIATGGLEIVPEQIRLRDLAAGLYNDLKSLAQDKGLRLNLDVDDALPDSIHHDETRLSQIVTNLVSNAIKFTDTGSIDLSFKRLNTDRLVIQVRDTGVGIPQSKQHLIFDDFFQVDGSSTRKQQGAGLGLAIVRRMVLLMNGKINLTSEVDKGSTFTVELPLDLPQYDAGDRRRQAEHIFAKSVNSTKPSPVAQG